MHVCAQTCGSDAFVLHVLIAALDLYLNLVGIFSCSWSLEECGHFGPRMVGDEDFWPSTVPGKFLHPTVEIGHRSRYPAGDQKGVSSMEFAVGGKTLPTL